MTKKNKITSQNKINSSSNGAILRANLDNLQNKIEIYQTKDNKTEIKVHFDNETLWMNQKQIAEVFGTKIPAINKHINNIINEGELRPEATISILEIVQKEGKREVARKIDFYNLDMIISVGYRVNSSKATQFRIWATERLKNYLVKGFAVNERRVGEYQKNLIELQKTIKLITDSADSKMLSSTETKGFLDIIANYTHSFILLNQFDSDSLNLTKLDQNITYEISYKEACEAITELKKQLIKKKEATALFGNQKNQSFAGLLGNITKSPGLCYIL